MCHRVLSPKKHVSKKYFVRVDNCLNSSHIEIFSNGIVLDDGYKCKKSILKILSSSNDFSECEVILTEGKFHQVKRMFGAIGFNFVILNWIRL